MADGGNVACNKAAATRFTPRAHAETPERRRPGILVLSKRAEWAQSWPSMKSAALTLNSPGASTFSCFTTPSSTIIE